MSAGPGLPLAAADQFAQQAIDALRPFVHRIEPVGSVRRRRPRVGDIELIAEPRLQSGLFGEGGPVLDPILNTLRQIGRWKSGKDRLLKVADAFDRPGLTLELYLVHEPSTWGVIQGIRTGPHQLGRYVVTVCKDFGFRVADGHATTLDGSTTVETDTEEQFFALAGVECVPPPRRYAQALALWEDRNRYRRPAAALRCRVCGCTEDDCTACVERTGEPCSWVPALLNPDGPICSACVPQEVTA